MTSDNIVTSKIMTEILWLNESVCTECGSQAVSPLCGTGGAADLLNVTSMVTVLAQTWTVKTIKKI